MLAYQNHKCDFVDELRVSIPDLVGMPGLDVYQHFSDGLGRNWE
jgi:hypothetical protein